MMWRTSIGTTFSALVKFNDIRQLRGVTANARNCRPRSATRHPIGATSCPRSRTYLAATLCLLEIIINSLGNIGLLILENSDLPFPTQLAHYIILLLRHKHPLHILAGWATKQHSTCISGVSLAAAMFIYLFTSTSSIYSESCLVSTQFRPPTYTARNRNDSYKATPVRVRRSALQQIHELSTCWIDKKNTSVQGQNATGYEDINTDYGAMLPSRAPRSQPMSPTTPILNESMVA